MDESHIKFPGPFRLLLDALCFHGLSLLAELFKPLKSSSSTEVGFPRASIDYQCDFEWLISDSGRASALSWRISGSVSQELQSPLTLLNSVWGNLGLPSLNKVSMVFKIRAPRSISRNKPWYGVNILWLERRGGSYRDEWVSEYLNEYRYLKYT